MGTKRKGQNRKIDTRRDRRIFDIHGGITWSEGTIHNIIRTHGLPPRLFMSSGLRPDIPDSHIQGAYVQIEGASYGKRFASFTSESFVVFDSYVADSKDLPVRGSFLTTIVDPSTRPRPEKPMIAWQVWFRRISHTGTKARIEESWSSTFGWQTAIRGIDKLLLENQQLAVDQVRVLAGGLALLDRTELRGRQAGTTKETRGQVLQKLHDARNRLEAYRQEKRPFNQRPRSTRATFLEVIEEAALDRNTVYRHGIRAGEVFIKK